MHEHAQTAKVKSNTRAILFYAPLCDVIVYWCDVFIHFFAHDFNNNYDELDTWLTDIAE